MALSLGLVSVALAFILLRRIRYLNLYPLALCYGYVLYPRPDPSLALALGLVTLWAMVIANIRAIEGLWIEGGIFLGGVGLYIGTLAPTLLPADAGEFQLVASLLGVAHPPGYPLYTLLGKASTLIPLGDLAYRVNLLSAVVGALTLALVGWAVHQLTPSPWPRLAAALALGGATTFWAQATTANVRGLTALFTVLILALTLAYGRKQRQRDVTLLGLAFGLGVTHHGSLGFLAIPVGAYLISVDSTLITRPQKLLGPLSAAVLSLSILLYLPIRDAAGAPMSPGDLTTLGGFTEHVMAEGFRGDMFALARFTLLPERLTLLKDILLMQFGSSLLVAILIGGALFLWRGSQKALALITGAFLVTGFVGLTYRAPQTVEYLMPTYVCLALLLGGGLGALLSWPPVRLTPAALATLLALSLYFGTAQMLAHYPSFALLHHDRSTRIYAQEVLQSAPQRATILANWHYVTPLRYLQLVEGQRSDITLRYVHPREGTSLPDLWLAEIGRHIQGEDDLGGPVVVTNFYPQFEASPYRFRPLGEAFLVVGPTERAEGGDVGEAVMEALTGTEPSGSVELAEASAGASGEPVYSYRTLHTVIGGKVELLGYRLEGRAIEPHRPLVLLLAWRPVVKLEQDISGFVHLVGADGTPMAQADARHASGQQRLGEVWVDRYTLFLRPTVLPGTYTLIAGAYTPLADGGWERLATSSGADHVSLDEVAVQPSTWPPVTLHPWHQPFTGGITLVGVDYDNSYPHSGRVYLHWHLSGETPSAQVVLLAEGQQQGQILLPENSSRSAYLSVAYDIPLEPSSLEIALQRAEDGTRLAPLGAWHLPGEHKVTLPPPQPDDRYLSLGGEMVLVGAQVKTGSPLSVRLDFMASRPLTRDYTLSLRLRGVDGQWEVQEDGTPAHGAIPTLKWIRGTRIVDTRRLSLPSNTVLDQARLELLVYDAFTLATLPPLDERLLAQGPLIPLHEIRALDPTSP